MFVWTCSSTDRKNGKHHTLFSLVAPTQRRQSLDIWHIFVGFTFCIHDYISALQKKCRGVACFKSSINIHAQSVTECASTCVPPCDCAGEGPYGKSEGKQKNALGRAWVQLTALWQPHTLLQTQMPRKSCSQLKSSEGTKYYAYSRLHSTVPSSWFQ